MKKHKSVKRPKPNAVVLYIKDAIKTYYKNIDTVNEHLAHEQNRHDHYVHSLVNELEAENYVNANHTNHCLAAAAKRINNFESVLATLIIQKRIYEKDLRNLREAYGFMRGKSLRDVLMEGDLAQHQYKKSLDISREIESRYSHVWGSK